MERWPWLRALLLVSAVFLAYQTVWHAGFIWDDDAHLTANRCIVGPLGLKEIWTSAAANYFPLVLTNFWVQHALWGLAPLPYHLVNIGMHAGCALLLWRVLRRLGVRGAWLGAAIWALHPVQVESVTWISELKNTQSCLFFLLAIEFFLRWVGAEGFKTGRWYYALAVLGALLAILSKPSTVMLPVVLGLCWWWQTGRWRWRQTVALLPFFLLSTLASGWTVWEQQFHSGALGAEWNLSWGGRLIVAGKVVWFYLGKLLWPHPLTFVYARWQIDATHALAYLPLLAILVLGLWLWRQRHGWLRPEFFAAAYFFVSLFPVLGFFNIYFTRYSYVSDHFQYLASIGPAALAGAGLASLATRRELRAALSGFLLLALGCLSWRQGVDYVDDATLWRATLRRNPDCWLAHNNLAVLLTAGQPDTAIAHLEQALRLKPDYPEAHYNLGNALSAKDRWTDAIAHYESALRLKPDYLMAHCNLGNALLRIGQVPGAIAHYTAALRIDPTYADAHYNLGNACFQSGRFPEAISHYEQALQLRPNFAEAHANLGNVLLQTGRTLEAIAHYRQALQLKPDFAEALASLGEAHAKLGDLAAAAQCFASALRLRPGFASVHYNWGNALLQHGQPAAAISHYEAAVRLQPAFAEAHANLANALVQSGRAADAIEHYRTAIRVRPEFVDAYFNLGLVLAGIGRPREAIECFQTALRLKPDFTEAREHLQQLQSPHRDQ